MDHQWRPIHSPDPTFCPFCSFSHFPFCPPPPPYHQNPRFPPPQQQPPPPPPYLDYPRPHPDPNFNYREEFAQPMYDYYNNAAAASTTTNGYMSETDMRKYKRPRVDDFGSNGLFLSDDERRLKLIRDHGSGNFDENRLVDGSNLYSPFRATQEFHRPYNSSGSNNNWQNHGMPNYAAARPDYKRPADQRGYMSENNWVFSGVARPPPPPRPSPPPLPASPPPPLPMEPVMQPSPPKTSSLFPVTVSSSISNPYLQSKSTGFVSEGWQQSSGQTFFPKQLSTERATMVDASHIFKQPHRATRANHIVIILRGLPGSGKSYLAKMMRDLEVENGGDAPRIHSMDDYFMTEVEKVEESDASKSSSSTRGKKPTVKKVMEYCYEPEMEEAYRDSMLKAFKKTLEEGIFTLVIVDDRNLRVADFAQFWAIAKRSGYEVYISEATYKDPAGCAARNVHGFTLDEIRSMAKQWEEAPSLYVELDIKSLFRGDDLKQSGIQEVDMDVEDEHFGQKGKPEKIVAPPVGDDAPHVRSEDGKKWYAEEDHPMRVKELGKSKWSNDLDEDDTKGSGGMRVNNALSGLIQAYQKQGKSVRWSDQVVNTGFSIGAAKTANMPSLVIGPGAGYNLKSNPLAEEECPVSNQSIGNSRHRIFQERLRKEQESFKAVFDRRKHRIGGLDFEEE